MLFRRVSVIVEVRDGVATLMNTTASPGVHVDVSIRDYDFDGVEVPLGMLSPDENGKYYLERGETEFKVTDAMLRDYIQQVGDKDLPGVTRETPTRSSLVDREALISHIVRELHMPDMLDGMKLADFEIGKEFICGDTTYLCTDKGTRTVTAILLDDRPEWRSGPPYAVLEIVLDEEDQKACRPVDKANKRNT
jgi:hypothetical protein